MLDLTNENKKREALQGKIHAQFGEPGSKDGFASITAPANIRDSAQALMKSGRMDGIFAPPQVKPNVAPTQTDLQKHEEGGRLTKAPQEHGASGPKAESLHGTSEGRNTQPWHVEKDTRLAGGFTPEEATSSWRNLITHLVAKKSEREAMSAHRDLAQIDEWAARRDIDMEKNRLEHARNLSQDEQWRGLLALDQERFSHQRDVVTPLDARRVAVDERQVKVAEDAESRHMRGQVFDEKMEATKEGRAILAAALGDKLGIDLTGGKKGGTSAEGENVTSAIASIIGKAFGPDTPMDQLADRIEEVVDVMREQGILGSGGRGSELSLTANEILEALTSENQESIVEALKKESASRDQKRESAESARQAWSRGQHGQEARDFKRNLDFIHGKGAYAEGGRKGPPRPVAIPDPKHPGLLQKFQQRRYDKEWEEWTGLPRRTEK